MFSSFFWGRSTRYLNTFSTDMGSLSRVETIRASSS